MASSTGLVATILALFTTLVLTSASNDVPSIKVPCCPANETVKYDTSVPSGQHDFPLTQVDLCYDATSIHLTFTAYNETNYFYNASAKTNDPIYKYEVMEAFLYRGENDPKTYLEFEVAPNNVSFNAFIYNPSKVRANGSAFDTFYIQTPQTDGLVATTSLDRRRHTWISDVRVPLGLFDVDDGQAKGTKWRMNFFRTVVDPKTYPNQTLRAWSPPTEANFHVTPKFGRVEFV